MKTIFVPYDFSLSAVNTLDLAVFIALKLETKLVLFNAFQVPPPIMDIPYKALEEEIQFKKQEVEKKLIEQCNHLLMEGKAPFGKIDFECLAIEGSMPGALLEHLTQHQVDLIIMGTNLAGHHTTSTMFGSTAHSVMAQAECPVLIIPEHVHVGREIRKITFATNYHSMDASVIAQLTVLARAFNAQLNVLHVYKDTVSTEEQFSSMNYFMKAVNSETNYSNITYQIMEGKDSEEKLKDYIVSSQDADIIVMSTHIRNWIVRMLGKSFTKRMVLKANVPLLIYRHQKEEVILDA